MKKYTNDEHYDEYATNPEYCGYLLRRKVMMEGGDQAC